MPASQPSVAIVSHHDVPIFSSSGFGMATWSHTARYQKPLRSAARAMNASSWAPALDSQGSA